MTKEEKRRLEQEYWKILHDEEGNLVPVTEGSSIGIEEYYRRNFPPEMAEEMIKRHESMMEDASRNYSDVEMKRLMEENSIDFNRLKTIKYEDI